MIQNGIKSSNDGTLMTTLGKKLVKVERLVASDLREPFSLGGKYKEITFAIVPDDIFLFIDKKDDEHKLTIEDKSSIEAQIAAAFIQAPSRVADNAIYEIWLWN